MKLIVAEKPTLARSITTAIGTSKFTKKDGYYESNDYIVTWGFGHLFGLIDVEEYYEDYDPDQKYSWSLEQLPFFPEKFKFALKKDPKTKRVDAGVKKQFNTIKNLIHRNDVSAIINAGDSDREGEIIVRIILANAGNKKPVERLWLPDQTPETIKAELAKVRDDKEYDNLANEGLARTFIDWLYGINLTRYATLKSGVLLRVGRVIVPIVKAVYDRDMEIKNFVPETYYNITSSEKTNGELVELTSKTTFKIGEEAQADAFCKKYNAVDAVVKDVKTERKTINPGKLFSLSKLEGVLGKKYKMGIQESLSVVQSLYESGYVTYPRTNTEYMATAEKDKVKSIIATLSKHGYPVQFKDSKSIFDDSKIESHSALTPTTKIPAAGALTEKEQKVYDVIKNRFVAVFCSEPCLVDRSTITIDVGDYETFTLKGDIVIDKGWMKYESTDKKDKILPKLKKGDIVNTNFKTVEKETTPPKHYTTETLNNYLKNPFKKESSEENDDEEYKAILNGLELGTEATRPAIIGNAIASGYISHKNDTYYIEDAGIYYIETLLKLCIDMEKNKTVELGKALKDVYKGEKTILQSINLAKDEIINVLMNKDIQLEKGVQSGVGIIGKCPMCGQAIKKQSWGYGCTGYKDGCKFSINSTIAGKKIGDAQVKLLLTKGVTNTIKGFKSKAGKSFDAKLKLENNKVTFAFDNAVENFKEVKMKCPNCGDEIINDKWAWKCKSSCGFSVNHIIAEKTITSENVEDLITNGQTKLIKGFKSKAGKKFDAKLVLENNIKTKFEF